MSRDLMRESAALARAHGVRLHTHLAEVCEGRLVTIESEPLIDHHNRLALTLARLTR